MSRYHRPREYTYEDPSYTHRDDVSATRHRGQGKDDRRPRDDNDKRTDEPPFGLNSDYYRPSTRSRSQPGRVRDVPRHMQNEVGRRSAYDRDVVPYDDRRRRRSGSHHVSRSHRYDDHLSHHHKQESTERTRSNSGMVVEASKAAAVAGLVESFRARHNSDRSTHALTAAAGAAALDILLQDKTQNGKRHLFESALGGLVLDRVANGSPKK